MNLKLTSLLIALCITGQMAVCPYGSTSYTVQPNDTFSTIAARYGTTVEAISAANPGVDSRYLAVGQQICVPQAGYNSGSNTGYNNNYYPNNAYPTNTYYGVNTNGQYNSYYPSNCNNYVIRAGDTCASLAGYSSTYFYQQNTGINCNNLQVGQSVCLPYGSNYGTTTGYNSGCQNYQIRSGDTCANLAAQAGVSLYEFNNLNGYLNCNNLQVGQSVCVPFGNAGSNMIGYSYGNRCYGKQYTVQNGDTCWAIATRYGTTVEQLQSCTGLNCNNLAVGQVINF